MDSGTWPGLNPGPASDTDPDLPETIPPPPDAPEHVRARYWREHIVRMSRPALSKAIGLSVSSISDIEAGSNRTTGKQIDAATMQRYRMACAALTLGVDFDWLTMSLIPDVPVEIRMFYRR